MACRDEQNADGFPLIPNILYQVLAIVNGDLDIGIKVVMVNKKLEGNILISLS